jgi:hypothetical protein
MTRTYTRKARLTVETDGSNGPEKAVNQASRHPRPKRRSFAEQRNSLTFDGQDPNYVYRVFNDVDGRLQKAEIAGYEYVRSDEQLGDPTVDSAKTQGTVVTKPVGSGRTGVLMRIKRDWYDEDQQAKLRKVQETENSLTNKTREDGHYGEGLSRSKA